MNKTKSIVLCIIAASIIVSLTIAVSPVKRISNFAVFAVDIVAIIAAIIITIIQAQYLIEENKKTSDKLNKQNRKRSRGEMIFLIMLLSFTVFDLFLFVFNPKIVTFCCLWTMLAILLVRAKK